MIIILIYLTINPYTNYNIKNIFKIQEKSMFILLLLLAFFGIVFVIWIAPQYKEDKEKNLQLEKEIQDSLTLLAKNRKK